MLRLQAEVCNFSRYKLHRRHFSRKVLKADKAFLFALFQSFCKTPLKWLLWSSFFKRLEQAVAYLALSRGECGIFEKGHRYKMMKFLIIVYFHVSMALWIIRAFSFFLNSVSNAYNIYNNICLRYYKHSDQSRKSTVADSYIYLLGEIISAEVCNI